MTQLPHVLKRIRLNLARSKEFPLGSDTCGYEFVAPLDARGHIDVELWRKHREHCAGKARMIRSAVSCTNPRDPSMHDGCSTTTTARRKTTKPDTALLITCFGLENMYPSGAKTANCTPFRWSRSNPRHEGLCTRSS